MIRIFAMSILLCTSACFASGWNDFVLDIGDGYSIIRCNSLDVNVGKMNGNLGHLILSSSEYKGVGPVINYMVTSECIFTKNSGRKYNFSQEYFFIIIKNTEEVIGPLSKNEFLTRPETKSLDVIDWKKPRNPNFWPPLIGNFMFLIMAIPILAIKFYWFTIPFIICVIFLIKFIIKNLKAKKIRNSSY